MHKNNISIGITRSNECNEDIDNDYLLNNNPRLIGSETDTPDNHRSNEPWVHNHEIYFQKVVDDCVIKQAKHDYDSSINKFLYRLTAIPMIIIPMVLSTFDSHFNHGSEHIRIWMLVILSIFTGIQSIINFGQRQQHHKEYSNKYNELAVIIETEIIKKKKHRMQVDVFTESVKNSYLNLNKNAP